MGGRKKYKISVEPDTLSRMMLCLGESSENGFEQYGFL